MSIHRELAVPKTNPTNVFTPNTLSYYDTMLNVSMPVPFIVTNGVLDVNVQDNVSVNLLTWNTFTNNFIDQPEYQCCVQGGLRPVNALGPNMVTFLTNFIRFQENPSSPGPAPSEITMYVAPTMTKVRFNYIEYEHTWLFADEAPSSDQLVVGGESQNYRTVWIFKSPLVVKYYSNQNSKYRYITLSSTMDSV